VETLFLNAGWHAWATTRKADAICFRIAFDFLFFCKMKKFSKKSEIFSETKKIFFFIYKSFAKRKCFWNESKILVKTKTFSFINHLQSENVFETKVNCFQNETVLIYKSFEIWQIFCIFLLKMPERRKFKGGTYGPPYIGETCGN